MKRNLIAVVALLLAGMSAVLIPDWAAAQDPVPTPTVDSSSAHVFVAVLPDGDRYFDTQLGTDCVNVQGARVCLAVPTPVPTPTVSYSSPIEIVYDLPPGLIQFVDGRLLCVNDEGTKKCTRNFVFPTSIPLLRPTATPTPTPTPTPTVIPTPTPTASPESFPVVFLEFGEIPDGLETTKSADGIWECATFIVDLERVLGCQPVDPPLPVRQITIEFTG